MSETTKINRASTPPLIKDDHNGKSSFNEDDDDEDSNGFLKSRKRNPNTATVGCMTFYSHRRHSHKGHSERHEQKNKAADLGKQLNKKWALQDLIDKQFKRGNQALTSNKPEDIAQMLSPIWAAPLEMAAVGWLGDWRPSAILEFLRSLAHSSYFSFSSVDSSELERVLAQLIHEIRIEEAIIDEEMAEIQANCILHLPFRPANQPTISPSGSLDSVQCQLKQIKQVFNKAQQLRCKVLELVMKKILSEADAGEFLVAFSGTQDILHQFAAQRKLQKGPVCVSVKDLTAV